MATLRSSIDAGDMREQALPGATYESGTLTLRIHWTSIGFVAVLLVAAVTNLYNLSKNGYGNLFYASAVKSMSLNWHNFFFASFDPTGFVTVDKPPVALWVQVLSAKVFGYSGVSLLLPQAIAGVLAVALLFHMVRRSFGDIAGLVAALMLALTPVLVVVSRDNNVDGILVLVMLAAAWAVLKAGAKGDLRWLVLCAFLVGVGFNTKMLEAYLVVPALALVYLLGAPITWRKRLLHLLIAGAIMVACSLSWSVIVDATPASQRPYVGSSQTNSELNLAFGYNGIQRLTGNLFGRGGGGRPQGSPTEQAQNNGFFNGENGAVGPLRLLNQSLGGQSGWLLPLGLIGLFASGWMIGTNRRVLTELRDPQQRATLWHDMRHGIAHLQLNSQQQSWMLYLMWLLTAGIFFSVAGFFHAYYLSIMAPAVAALAGVGAVLLWRDYLSDNWRGWLLPLAVVVTALVQAHLVSYVPDYSNWLTPLVLTVACIGAAILSVVRLVRLPQVPDRLRGARDAIAGLRPSVQRLKLPAWSLLGVGIMALGILLLAPTVWTVATVNRAGGGGLASAGPTSRNTPFGNVGGGIPGARAGARPTGATFGGNFGAMSGAADPKLISYLEAHKGTTRYLVATTNSMSADPIIINSDLNAISIGGFSGGDKILTTADLAQLVATKQLRYFLAPGDIGQALGDLPPAIRDILEGGRAGQFFGQSSALTMWVGSHCSVVPTGEWSSARPTTAGPAGVPPVDGSRSNRNQANQLYDCSQPAAGVPHQ